MTPEAIAALEAVAARAWRPEREDTLGSWRLNASQGFSGRINACWPLGDPGPPLEEAVIAAEAWLGAAGLSPLFKVVGAACEPGLTALLARRGYRPRTETAMMVASLTSAPASDDALLASDPDADFASVFAAAAADAPPGDAAERLGALARIPAPRAFARLAVAGAPAAIGACAVEGPWAGIFAMRTVPAQRRRGLAARILAALLGFAHARGARRAWLQVETANAPALALYRGAGFNEAYRYAYWDRDTLGGGA